MTFMVVSGNVIEYFNVTCGKGNHICIPKNYSKYELPEVPTNVSLGIDIINIPKIDDNDFSVTLRKTLGSSSIPLFPKN